MPSKALLDDRPGFFNPEEFGSAATINGGVIAPVVLSDRFFSVDVADAAVETYPYMAWVEAVYGVDHDDTLEIDGTFYRVVKRERDLDVDRVTLHKL